MDYEKKYEEALEKAKSMIDDLRKGEDILAVSDLESMFPELAESEDDRIREAIIDTLNRVDQRIIETNYGIKHKDAVAWLEKQGEQKPAWSEEEEVKINRIVAFLKNLNVADNDIILKDR